jgi:hypothetical protein
MLRAARAAGQQLHRSYGAAWQLPRKAGENRGHSRSGNSDEHPRGTRAVKIMTRQVVDYQLLQSPTPLAEKPRVLLEKTGAQ